MKKIFNLLLYGLIYLTGKPNKVEKIGRNKYREYYYYSFFSDSINDITIDVELKKGIIYENRFK